MKKNLKNLIISLLMLVLFSCEADEDMLTYNSEIVSIEYGTSFGECLGYCNGNLEIAGTEVKYNASGHTVTGALPDILISGEISIEEWQSLIESIDVLIFRNMEEVIGCPDCRDGGAEWIEIITDEITHKVIFEFNNEPEEFDGFIEGFRELIEEYEDKMN